MIPSHFQQDDDQDECDTDSLAFLGVDTGGTFTDFVLLHRGQCRVHKVLSTPHAPEEAILKGVAELGLAPMVASGRVSVVHGSTVATNAALEKKGVKTVYITNKGFADVLSLARQNRPDIYALNPIDLTPPVPSDLCVEVNTRCDHRGALLEPLSKSSLALLKESVDALAPEAIAINLLYSFVRDDEERAVEALWEGENVFVSRSSEVLPEYKEYERGMATWLNAWLGPKVAGYLTRLGSALQGAPLAVMQSSGGTIAAHQAARRAVNLLLSGPAGGLSAALFVGKQTGCRRLLTFDMGGTSTDVALLDGQIKLTSEGFLADYPVAVPMVDMHTIGAGGGSIAYLDQGGLLHVGPESAGADPGPACYGKGGADPTVTDANVVLGRLRPELFLGGEMSIDARAAQVAVSKLAKQMGETVLDAARGIIELANEHMVRALRVISVQKGFDPKEFALCCFGGAGGLHVCALAEALGVELILVPSHGGVLSALGMLVAPRQRDVSKSLLRVIDDPVVADVSRVRAELFSVAEHELRNEGVVGELDTSVVLDCRYQGQSFSLSIAWFEGVGAVELIEAFHRLHENTFGHKMPLPVELVNVRVQVKGAEACTEFASFNSAAEDIAKTGIASVQLLDGGSAKVLWREHLKVGERISGPAIVCEKVATTYVAKGWTLGVTHWGHMQITRA